MWKKCQLLGSWNEWPKKKKCIVWLTLQYFHNTIVPPEWITIVKWSAHYRRSQDIWEGFAHSLIATAGPWTWTPLHMYEAFKSWKPWKKNEGSHKLVLLVSVVDLIKMLLPSSARSAIKKGILKLVFGELHWQLLPTLKVNEHLSNLNSNFLRGALYY